MMKQVFKLADFCFEIEYPKDVIPTDNFFLFKTEGEIPEYSYKISTEEELPKPEGSLLMGRTGLHVYGVDGMEERLKGVKGNDRFYACYKEISENEAKIICQKDQLFPLTLDPGFASVLALERRLIKKNALILHSAYLEFEGEAILFSAASGVGKSTQAGLWEKYKGAKTVNGDRSLLQKNGEKWFANGYPVCGSSEICNNISLPIKAIVMLSQEKENTIRRLTTMQAFREIFSQIMINNWDTKNSIKWMDLIQQMVTEIDVYHLGCDISKEAVECLYNELYNMRGNVR